MKKNVTIAAGDELGGGAAGEGAGGAWGAGGGSEGGTARAEVEVGLGVLSELMEEEVEEIVGPKGKRYTERGAFRHGHEGGEVTLGGRRVQVRRPRVRTADGESEVALADLRAFRRP